METIEQMVERMNSLGFPHAVDGDEMVRLHPEFPEPEEEVQTVVLVRSNGAWVLKSE